MKVPKPGIHFIIMQPTKQNSHIAFPDVGETKDARHRWVLVRKSWPDVPQLTKTPLLRKNMDNTEGSRIQSVYLRPWTLLRAQARLNAAYLADLDIVLNSLLNNHNRCRSKRSVGGIPSVQRSLTSAWDDYKKQHIVSQHALQLVRNLLLTQVPDKC